MSVGPLFASLLQNQPPCESSESAIPERRPDQGSAANPANRANPGGEIRKLAGFAEGPRLAKGLRERICAMAARWQYTPEELAEALNCAATDPAAWLGACDLDEELHRHRRPDRWRDIDADFWPEEQ